MAANSIFDGTDEIIHRALGLSADQHLNQKSTCKRLSAKAVGIEVIARLVGELCQRVMENWSGREPSQANWRLERQTDLSERNTSPEVILERAIALLAERGMLEHWYNQIPVASGLIDGKADKRAAVDLIRFDGNALNLIELKINSNNPVFSVFEILRYGFAYLLCRDNRHEFGFEDKDLLMADEVVLDVLAPSEFYEPYEFGFLSKGINEGLRRLSVGRADGLKLAFRFLAFPEGFRVPFASGKDVLHYQGLPLDSGPNRVLIDAMNNLQPVWEEGCP